MSLARLCLLAMTISLIFCPQKNYPAKGETTKHNKGGWGDRGLQDLGVYVLLLLFSDII